jgi:OFA family oxalate/formate antiporter-like MFS transporter
VALSFGRSLPELLVYAAGIGIGYGLAFFASTILLLDYFGRRPNLELFAIVNLISTVGSAAPALAGLTRDHAGSYVPFYLLLAVLMAAIAVITLFLKKPDTAS